MERAYQIILTIFSTILYIHTSSMKRQGMKKWEVEERKKKPRERGWSGREKRREGVSLWAVIRGSQQGGQWGLLGSGKSSTKQPFSSLAASLRGTSQAYLSSRLLNRLTSGSHPTRTRAHAHAPPSLIPTDPKESRPRCSLADNFNFFFNLTSPCCWMSRPCLLTA